MYDASGTDPSQLTSNKMIYRGAVAGHERGAGSGNVKQSIYKLDEDWNYGLRFIDGLTMRLFRSTSNDFDDGTWSLNLYWKSAPPVFVL